MRRGNSNRVSETEVVKFIKIGRKLTYAVHLIYAEHNRLSALLKHGCDLVVGCHNTVTHVRYKNDYICTVYGKLCLTPHLREDYVVGVRLYTAGINKKHVMTKPLAVTVNPVARYTGRVIDNRQAFSYKFIEQCRLSDIRSSYNCHYRS